MKLTFEIEDPVTEKWIFNAIDYLNKSFYLISNPDDFAKQSIRFYLYYQFRWLKPELED